MGTPSGTPSTPRTIGRYVIHEEIASGGMATVHLGRLLGPAGFSRTVAIKRLFPQFARDPEFVAMLLDEARLAARVRHPNVVPTLDVVASDGEIFLVMEYVQGESLARLLRMSKERGELVPQSIVSAILAGALHGLHAAHDAKNEQGEPLDIVHRDVSPQNLLVGADGVARVLDFGVAKAVGRLQATREGRVKGKLAYMAPEHLQGAEVDRQADVFASAIVLWEALTGTRLFDAELEPLIVAKVLEEPIVAPSRLVPGLPTALDVVTLHGLRRDPQRRYASAEAMALALESAQRPALPSEVAAWVASLAGGALAARARLVAEIESGSRTEAVPTDVDLLQPAGDSAPSSQISTISVSSRAATSRRESKPGWVVAAVVGASAVTAIGMTFAQRHSPQAALSAPQAAPAAFSPESSSASTSSQARSAPELLAPGPAPTDGAAAPESAMEPPSSDALRAGPPTSARAAPRMGTSDAGSSPARPVARPPPQPRPGGARSTCYTVDGQGIWHIKPSCL